MYSYVLAELEARKLTVSTSEIDEVIDEHKSINGEKRSDEAFEGIVRDNFGLTMPEYRRLVMLSLAKRKLSIEIDNEAKETAEKVEALLQANGNDFAKVADALKDNEILGYESAGNAVEVIEPVKIHFSARHMAYLGKDVTVRRFHGRLYV